MTLTEVLDHAEALVHEDPLVTLWLARAARTLASGRGWTLDPAPGLVSARAALLEGQGLAIDGRLDEALLAVDAARDAFAVAAEPWLALRTGLGRMHILNELGRTTDAVQVGTELLRDIDALEDSGGPQGSMPFAVDWLRASCLTNLGVCHTFAGDYVAAAAVTAAAERHLLALGRLDEIAILRQNQAEQLLAEGRASRARDMFAYAAIGFADAGLSLLEARCLADLGRAHVALGEGAQALDAFGRAERLLEPLDVAAETEQVRLYTAEAYLALNLYEEAALVYREVVESVSASGLAHYHALALAGRGAALAALHRWDDAGTTLEEAADRHDRVGNVPLAIAARVELAAVLDRRGDHDGALDLLRALRAATDGDRHWVERVYVLLGLADVAGTEEASTALVEAASLVDRLGLPPLRFRVDSRLGVLRRRQGRLVEALALLQRAAKGAEDQRGLLPSQLTRTSFLRDKSRTFDELVSLHLDLDPDSADVAFRAAERAKGRALLDLLNTAGAPGVSSGLEPDMSVAPLVAELSAVYDEMLCVATVPQDPAPRDPSPQRRTGELRRCADDLQARLSVARISQIASPEEPLGVGRRLDHEGLRERFDDGTVLVAYHVVGDDVIGFLGVGDRLVARRVTTLTRLAPQLTGLEQHWRLFRAGAAFVERHASRLAAVVERDLHLLARELLGDLQLPPPTAGVQSRLAVVVPPALQGVPFHALQVAARPLVADWEVVTGPSGSVLGSLPPWTYDGAGRSVALAAADSELLEDAVEDAEEDGAVVVASAGNDNRSQRQWPAADDDVV
ncbi:MAG: tetratricopeptide repeat protein, partial [Nocardioidaceae bacterium]|nr:tetratricopeptide repeat protein [Nocardioidaceae bacterium]